METCERCGHPLGVGRFCLGCGHPAPGAGPTDTAERPAVVDPSAPTAPAPVTPPPVLQAPPQPRFPLYADEVPRGPMPSGPPPASPPAGPPAGPSVGPSSGHRAEGPSHRPGWLPWAVGAVALLLAAVVGGVLLLTGGDDDGDASARDTSAAGDSPTPTPTPTPTSEAPTPAPSPTPPPTEPAEPEDVARRATAEVPRTAPPNTDVEGNLVRFEARNMLDGVASTCWRMPGDGTGETITITLAGPTTLTEVGMVNGYAKSSRDGGRTLDWYRGNRRVLTAEWTFDDGTTVTQHFGDDRRPQMVDVDSVTTSTVTLRLVEVSSPGTGRARRDYTAISDLSLVGTPGS